MEPGVRRRVRARPAALGLLTTALIQAACAPEAEDIGSYRVLRHPDPVLFGCQGRTELYFVDRAVAEAIPVYLGTCGTPRYVTRSMGYESDPSCWAISPDGSALVYLHRPNWCGAGERARAKPGGVYLHSARGGDSLRYADPKAGQVWSMHETPEGAIRVRWSSPTPSRSGAERGQNLLVYADGREEPEPASQPPPG